MSEQPITIKDIEPLVPFSRGSTEIFHTGLWSSKKPRWRESTSSCRQACPIGNDIARAFSHASAGRIDEALRIFREDNPLPGVCGRVCYHPCEKDCNRKDLDEALNIRGFERYLSDHGRVETQSMITKTEKIAVVGSGPAGLSAAYHLARSGYGVTVFEALPEPGGMLMYGIPEYRLPKDVLRYEIGHITALGVDIRTGVKVGKDIGLGHIKKDFHAVFLAVGAHKGTAMDGTMEGIAFLRKVNSGETVSVGQKVAVIGGGNTAIDCARVARRLGAIEVTIIYRRSRHEMPALPEDIAMAETEGICFEFLAAPKQIGTGKIECIRMDLGPVDESERARPVPRQGSEFTIAVDTVIAAVGQVPETGFAHDFGITLGNNGIIHIASSSATSMKGVFAGGDGAGSKAYVADAIASGKKAALAICSYLEGLDESNEYERRRIGQGSSFVFTPTEGIDLKEVVTSDQLNTICVPFASRNKNPSLGEEATGTFKESTGGLDIAEAESEIARCLNCGTCNGCDLCFLLCPDISIVRNEKGYSVRKDYCKGCGVCVTTCPRHAITMGGSQ
jgi:NADPH-dependent glutamate synthase beta subunit-like oxidoreductase